MCSIWATARWNASLLTAPGRRSRTSTHSRLGPRRRSSGRYVWMPRAGLGGSWSMSPPSLSSPLARVCLFRPGSLRAATAASPTTCGNIREIGRPSRTCGRPAASRWTVKPSVARPFLDRYVDAEGWRPEGGEPRNDRAFAEVLGLAADSGIEVVAEIPQTRFVRSGDVDLAYQVFGAGEDMVAIPGLPSHLEVMWELPEYAAFLDRLASFRRVIMFDKRGTGMSDRVPGVPALEEQVDDIIAVMDAAGSARACVAGWADGAFMAAMFAATYPERVSAVGGVLGNAGGSGRPAAMGSRLRPGADPARHPGTHAGAGTIRHLPRP